MEREKIKTFAINLKHRADRRKHIIGQFERKKEFDLEIFDAIIDQNGSLGLIKSVLSIVKTASELDLDYVLICEDDHQFTEHFSSEFLLDQIHTSKRMGAEVLLGGVSWYDAAVRVKENLYWLNQFNGTQFLLIYKNYIRQF
ncbi:hypothetical protein KUH03_31070 [Sphingobacterium sp. E70]|uniref:hypothetical protein n=1 Tax=Sphingobacterium sp. E70 TaxID=2853439 RepID=UPI00211B8CDF|nr:hypothetical protein [Sphingobacterium sp. E70]ULT23578.1 hypothetical protein KUH03_31070 [Sphingobacterium sp. E70]